MSYSLNSLKGVTEGIIYGPTIGVTKGDTRSLDCSSCSFPSVDYSPLWFPHCGLGVQHIVVSPLWIYVALVRVFPVHRWWQYTCGRRLQALSLSDPPPREEYLWQHAVQGWAALHEALAPISGTMLGPKGRSHKASSRKVSGLSYLGGSRNLPHVSGVESRVWGR